MGFDGGFEVIEEGAGFGQAFALRGVKRHEFDWARLPSGKDGGQFCMRGEPKWNQRDAAVLCGKFGEDGGVASGKLTEPAKQLPWAEE